jgi:hypothetical protein
MSEWADRFWSKVDVRGEDECWPWKAGKLRKGYGCFHIGRTVVGAHRAAWATQHGRSLPPSDVEVMHSCDNPPCCNPNHLSLGTRKQNAEDMAAKKRAAPQAGRANNNVRLSVADVEEIKSLVARGVRITTVASDFKVCPQHVHDILSGRRWAD